MAIKKSLSCNCGYSGEYIKIENIVDSNDSSKKVSFDVCVYKDKATCDAHGQPLKRQRVSNVSCPSGAKSDLYTHLKSLSDYSGAEDC